MQLGQPKNVQLPNCFCSDTCLSLTRLAIAWADKVQPHEASKHPFTPQTAFIAKP